jgi:hypothetical protein
MLPNMTEPDDTLKSDEPQPPRQGGPFSVEPVDPLIYRQSNDSPEMRAAAAYIPVASRRLKIDEPKPEMPEAEEHDQWTPGAAPVRVTPNKAQETPAEPPVRLSMRILTAILILVPVALIIAAVALGASLADF